jgi:hypothetical protein
MVRLPSEAFVEAELAYRASLRGSAADLVTEAQSGRGHRGRWHWHRRATVPAAATTTPATPATPTVRAPAAAAATPAQLPGSLQPVAGARIVDIRGAARRPHAAA